MITLLRVYIAAAAFLLIPIFCLAGATESLAKESAEPTPEKSLQNHEWSPRKLEETFEGVELVGTQDKGSLEFALRPRYSVPSAMIMCASASV